MTLSYDRSSLPVREDIVRAHQDFWRRLAAPGAWWTGVQRLSIAQEARAAEHCPLCAERKAALSPYTVDGRHASDSELPSAAVEAVHRLVTDPGRLTKAWFDTVTGAHDGAIRVEQYVELLGTVVAIVSIDQFCRAIGLALHDLPVAVGGQCSAYRPQAAQMQDAWVPMVPVDNANTPEADLWPSGRGGNVIRAMSLVPEEVRTLNALSAAHYLPNAQVRDPAAHKGALSRAQMELTAGRVSAQNGCYY